MRRSESMLCRRRLDAAVRPRHFHRVSARTILRTATAAKHQTVDAAFSGFDLTNGESYGHFLAAHARALPAVERALAQSNMLPPFEPRTPLLKEDLEALGLPMPDPLPLPEPQTKAAAFGA